MKVFANSLGATFLSALVAATAVAQPTEGRGGRERNRERGPRTERQGREGRQRPPSPIMAALDTDQDGEISAKEIENAVAALKTLDKDGNGTLSRQELFAQADGGRGEGFGRGGFGRGGFGGPGGPGGRGGRGPGGGDFVARLMQEDKNGDGKLTKDEVPERMQRMFDRVDANGDGAIDKAELEQMAQRFQGGGRQGSGRGGRPEGDRPERRRRPQRPDSDS